MPKKQKFPHLLNSKWTAREATFGWRHFQVMNRKNEGAWVFAELMSSCDPTVKFWINAQTLKDRRRWLAGWKTLEEIEVMDAKEAAKVQALAQAQETPKAQAATEVQALASG
ncbi:MAG: hypothetical protein RLZZ511_46 [Cyanobacteriota bacterium]|jgi:tryptophan-rich hypothetical protein